ncbi:MAG: ThuA protein [Pedosphaera sp.]|nr:ThuA protein [Pedosphaera sp.]
MMTKFNMKMVAAVLLVMLVGVAAFADDGKLKVLLITGGHPFDTNDFYKVFDANSQIAVTHDANNRTNAPAYEREDLLSFDVVVLYDMPLSITEAQKAKFLSLFDKGVGLVVLHHALVSYQHWPEYGRIVGGKYPEADGQSGVVTPEKGYQHDVEVPVEIVAKKHPITAGLKDFTIHDEIYWGFRVGPDVTTLITTSQPKSGKPLGWCRKEKKSRVVYLQLGHDHQAYENPGYRELVARSVRWAAGR